MEEGEAKDSEIRRLRAKKKSDGYRDEGVLLSSLLFYHGRPSPRELHLRPAHPSLPTRNASSRAAFQSTRCWTLLTALRANHLHNDACSWMLGRANCEETSLRILTFQARAAAATAAPTAATHRSSLSPVARSNEPTDGRTDEQTDG